MPDVPKRLRVLIIAPYLNGDGLGEVYSIFKWVEALAERADITVLTVNDGEIDAAKQLPRAQVISFLEPTWLNTHFRKLNMSAKPWLPVFFSQVRRRIRFELARGTRWDVAHQVLPQAMRYASPLRDLGIPYVVGPLGGSLETPPGFQGEVRETGFAARARKFDRWRLRHDRALRRGYEGAELILGVAPYVAETLRETGVAVRRFEPILERGHEGRFPEVTRTSGPGEAHLLHVGRGVRTKGLRDVVRALAELRDLPGVRLTSAGDGPEIALVRTEAETLGVADQVRFLGQVPRQQVDVLYAAADIFAFPSFREPMGGVFFEAMEWGLPVIAAARGGPDFILDDTCAIRLQAETPAQFAHDIAQAIRALALDPERRRRMGAAAVERLKSVGGWSERAARLEALYREILTTADPSRQSSPDH